VLGRVAPQTFAWTFPEGTPKRSSLSGYTTVAVMLLLGVVAGLGSISASSVAAGAVVLVTSAFSLVLHRSSRRLGHGLPSPDGDLTPIREARHLHAAFSRHRAGDLEAPRHREDAPSISA
jgi:hypothetical protein